MLTKDILLRHYAEYAGQPDSWVSNMAVTKESIVGHVLAAARFMLPTSPVRVAVLGASDPRYITLHKQIFEKLTGKNVQMNTLDIDTEHLKGGEGALLHDVTVTPFPGSPYSIVFSHELMKFLTAEEQIKTLCNSYTALDSGGIAMHIMHEPSIKGTAELRSWQFRVDPDALLASLIDMGIPAEKLVFESESNVPWLRETTVLLLKKS